jgi:hypothetical protein
LDVVIQAEYTAALQGVGSVKYSDPFSISIKVCESCHMAKFEKTGFEPWAVATDSI